MCVCVWGGGRVTKGGNHEKRIQEVEETWTEVVEKEHL